MKEMDKMQGKQKKKKGSTFEVKRFSKERRKSFVKLESRKCSLKIGDFRAERTGRKLGKRNKALMEKD